MWNNYSRGKNVIITSSMLAFSDDATTQKRVFKVDFFCICLILMTKICKVFVLENYETD